MPTYRRPDQPGGTFFFTVVTHRRARILTTPVARQCLRAAYESVALLRPFTTDAICVLPDHLHAIWTLPEGDSDFSGRWRSIKHGFSRRYLAACPPEEGQGAVRSSRQRRREVLVWGRRFWEHRIRDDRDLHAHLDYVHWNPVKHGLVERPLDYEWSSFHRHVRLGHYEPNWGSDPASMAALEEADGFGEPGEGERFGG